MWFALKPVWIGVISMVAPLWAVAGIAIKTEQLPFAIKGAPYSADVRIALDGRCPLDDVQFLLAGGALPPGLKFTIAGLGGIPRAMGAFRFTLRASSSCGSADRELELFVTGKPIMHVTPETVNVQVHAGETARPVEAVLVSSTWRGLPYQTSDPQDRWLTLHPMEGATPEEGSPWAGDRLMLEIDPSKLLPGVHRQTIRVSAWQAANAPAIEVIVTVLPKS